MNEAHIVRKVHDFFHKEFDAGAPKTFCTECWRGDWGGRADLAFIRSRSDNLHVVEAKASLDGAFKAIEQLQKYPANYWWIALPADEYVPGAGLLKAASARVSESPSSTAGCGGPGTKARPSPWSGRC